MIHPLLLLVSICTVSAWITTHSSDPSLIRRFSQLEEKHRWDNTASVVEHQRHYQPQSQQQHPVLLAHHTHNALMSPDKARDHRRNRKNRGWEDAKVTSVKLRALKKANAKTRTITLNQKVLRHDVACPGPDRALAIRGSGTDLPYESSLAALNAYYDLHNDLVIPRRYVVPESCGFPQEWVGLDLSSAVYNMKWWQKNVKSKPERVHELNQMGFVWERLQPEWNLVLAALITYHSFHGDLLVSSKFVVPHGYQQWPKATWGLPLGNFVYRIRARNDFLHGAAAGSRRNQLDRLGFVWDVSAHRFSQFYAVLDHYAKLHGCGRYSLSERPKALCVPSTFRVPKHESWPRHLWNYPLGVKCTAIRQKELYVKNKPYLQKQLEELGFRWKGNADLGWLRVVHAAAIYSKINNQVLDVPYKYVVPEPSAEDEMNDHEWPWPQHLYGLPLGQRLKDIRVTGAYLKGEDGKARRRQLDALGFVWNVREHRFQIFYAALQRYAQLNQCGKFSGFDSEGGNNLKQSIYIAKAFVVPNNDDDWPRNLWHFDLGKKCSLVRTRGLYVKGNSERQKMIKELGFRIEKQW